MDQKIKSKYLSFLIITLVSISLIATSHSSLAKNIRWDEEWSYDQELDIPFDTSLDSAHFQPIDTKIDFEKPCWAKNEEEHSIRICCLAKGEWYELESQIYNLEKKDCDLISSCNIVFLIPEFADGSERYYIYYDDSEKPAPNYFDHVSIEESYYRFEPIPGYPLESNYYKVIDDEYIRYIISYNGQFMGYNTCQHIYKMKDDAVEVIPKNTDLFAAFTLKYCYEDGLFGYSSTSQKLISKEIIVDGNLMVEVGIISTSNLNDLQTTATYKYYHCPLTNSRVHTHVKHEALKEINVYKDAKTDGAYASLQIGGVKSKSIQELNIGRILPFMNYYNEQETISEYNLDIDPEYIPENPDIRLISIQDDVDLGKKPWMSFNEGKTGISHCVILSSNNVVVSGSDEQDGIQINAFQMDYPHLPGLENNIAVIQMGRNSVEPGKNQDFIIPDDFVVEFDAEFFSSKSGGLSVIGEETEIFQNLVKIKPQSNEISNENTEKIEKHNLSVYVHFASSAKMGSTISALLGLNMSYINIELHKDDEFVYSENAVRLPLNAIEELKDSGFFEKIISTMKIFDIKNISFFKRAYFSDIDEGKYVVKIFKENPFIGDEKKYIGYAIIDLQENEKTHVICGSETDISVAIIDQNDKFVKNAEVLIQKDEVTIAKGSTDEKGHAIIKAPATSKSYDLKVIYNGCAIYQEPVKIGFLQTLISVKKTIDIQRYNLNLKVKDTWGQMPAVDLNPIISIVQDDAVLIHADKNKKDEYVFTNLTPNNYLLALTFKSFTMNQEIEVSNDKEIELEFPAEYNVKFNVLNSRGEKYDNSKIIVSRNKKKLELWNKESETTVTIPPGSYKIEVYDSNELISTRNIDVYGLKEYDLVTNQQPIYLSIVIASSIILSIICISFLYYKKQLKYFYIPLFIILVTTSLFLPWWQINGNTDQLETSTNFFIIPNSMITLTTTENTITGEQSYLPDELLLAITGLIILAASGCILVILNQYLKNTGKKRIYKLSKIVELLFIIGPVLIFIIAINEISKVGVGSILGNGYLDIGVPGESQTYSILCNWSPAEGFFVYILALILLFIIFCHQYRQNKDEKKRNQDKKTIQHPLFGISFKNWFYLLQKNGGVDKKYILRGLFIGLSAVFFTPIRMLFKLKYEEKINNSEIKNPPVFIIGHWRSGTTYLHELLSEDPQFCYITLWHTLLPDSFPLLEPIKKFMAKFLPEERPMDKIKVEIDGPYEEEAGIAILSPWSFFHGLHFPKNAEEQYVKSIHYKGLSKEEKERWDKSYHEFMKTVSYTNKGKRLLLKDPANTARIPTLLKLFPDAKFIHIYRNPYKVYVSTVKMRNKVLEKLALQDGNKEEIEKQVINNYKRLMNAYFEKKKLIPEKNFVEISYEDLVKDPIKQTKKIYSKLKLPGFKNALPGMKKYLESKKNYKTNVYKIDEKIIKHVEKQWDFTIKRWNYKPPK